MACYLVTGGAGFIGSHLVQTLLDKGHTVRVIDNLSTGKRSNLPEGADFFEKDFCRLDEIRPIFEGVDGVFHVGALPRVVLSIKQPVETAQANIMGTLSVLVAARDAGVKRVVYSSSCSAYGNAPLPFTPDMPALPLNPYALQKYVGELWMKQFSMLYNLETVSLRYFNVYGPRMADEGAYVTVIAVFKELFKRGEPLTIDGDGEQTRDMTHVYDVVNANILAMESSSVGRGEVLNVGSGERHSVNEIAKIFGGPTINRPSPRGDGEARNTLADVSLTKQLLGWEPNVSFQEGVTEVCRLEGIEPHF